MEKAYIQPTELSQTADSQKAPQKAKKPLLIIDCGHSGFNFAQRDADRKAGIFKQPLDYYGTRGKFFNHSKRDKTGKTQLPIYKGKEVELHAEGWFFEGAENRKDGAILIELLQPYVDAGKLEIITVADELIDTPLQERTNKANAEWVKRDKPPVLYYSIHYNAASADARGICLFTTEGVTNSDKAAQFILNELLRVFPKWERNKQFSPCVRIKDDNPLGGDYEENFWVLRNFLGAAVLREGGFFTTTYETLNIVYDVEKYKMPMLKAEAAGILNFLGITK